jgi:hypothetical protein
MISIHSRNISAFVFYTHRRAEGWPLPTCPKLCATSLRCSVYVLHAFQKKSKHGIVTPKSVMDTVKKRLQRAMEIDRELEK